MSWEIGGFIAEMLGAVAVVISLIYVGKQVKSSTEQAISDRLGDAMMIASSSDLGGLVIRAIDNDASLTREERSRVVFFFSGWLRTMEQAHRQYKRGYLDKQLWQGYESYLRTVVPADLLQEYWKHRRTIFNEDFRRLVDDVDVNETRGLYGSAISGDS